MDIAYDWRPSEIARRLQLFVKDVMVDFDLRFPENRQRRLLELQLRHQTEASKDLEQLLVDYDVPERASLSLFDWNILCEWHERWLRASVLSEIQQTFLEIRSRGIPTDPQLLRISRDLETELETIEQKLNQLKVSFHPQLWELMKLRWHAAALRRDAAYYQKRLLEIRESLS